MITAMNIDFISAVPVILMVLGILGFSIYVLMQTRSDWKYIHKEKIDEHEMISHKRSQKIHTNPKRVGTRLTS
jgi:hypothetical protein